MSKKPTETKIAVTIKGDQRIDVDVSPDEAEDWGASLTDMATALRKEQARKARRRGTV